MGLQRNHVGPIRCSSSIHRRLQFRDRVHGLGVASLRLGQHLEIDADLGVGPLAVVEEIVERHATLIDLQPIDDRVPAVVADDHDHFVTTDDRAVQVGVEHHRRAVTNKHDDLAVWHRHLGAPATGNLVAHTTEAVFTVEAVDLLRAPPVVDLARESTGSRQHIVAGLLVAVDSAHDLSVGHGFPGRDGVVAWRSNLVDVRVVAGPLCGCSLGPCRIDDPVAKSVSEFLEPNAGISNQWQGTPLAGVEPGSIEANDRHVRVLEQRPRTSGEVF